ncbi:MAG: SgcJ/EcaC family oxidoreductase [Stellaceae bacterium]
MERPQKEGAADNAEAARSAIAEIATEFARSWNSHDARAFAAIFNADADFTNVLGMVAKGRSAIEHDHAAIFKTMFKRSHLTLAEPCIDFIRSDVAAVDLHWEMSGALDLDGREASTRRGLLNWIVTSDAGTWLIAVFHNLELPDPAAMKKMVELQRQWRMA